MLLSASDTRMETRFTLLHSSRSHTELPPREILQPLLSHAQTHPDELQVALYVDSNEDTSLIGQSDLRMKRIDKPDIIRALGLEDNRPWWKRVLSSSSTMVDNKRRILVLVCGPDP